ncbi:uncharacterized protein LOC129328782 [Eublepharis macularius]|uniref:Uncharacterized protein LOC129328782 n=1 Tax=Eublepharis macularius TaxID=481883 RepID=A0AA97JAD9_EUBMA|nr:uncharacterized protein LOC129328782 [Eublepharis macularius]
MRPWNRLGIKPSSLTAFPVQPVHGGRWLLAGAAFPCSLHAGVEGAGTRRGRLGHHRGVKGECLAGRAPHGQAWPSARSMPQVLRDPVSHSSVMLLGLCRGVRRKATGGRQPGVLAWALCGWQGELLAHGNIVQHDTGSHELGDGERLHGQAAARVMEASEAHFQLTESTFDHHPRAPVGLVVVGSVGGLIRRVWRQEVRQQWIATVTCKGRRS